MITLEKILENMRKNNLKITPQRRLIAKYIADIGKTICVKNLYETVKKELPDVSMDTIYRSLNTLCETGMLYRINKPGSTTEYEIIAEQHLHYMVCLECGQKQIFEKCLFDSDIIKEEEKKGFLITGHKFELYGFCPKCRNKKER